MGTGYTRQSAADIADGNTIFAADVEDEFDAIQAAFHGTTGHAHDGTTGEGPKIALSTSVTGLLAVANGGIAGVHKVNATTAPTVNDDTGDNYAIGSWWIDITNDVAYLCLDPSNGAAVWQRYQPYDADLTALAGVTSAADKVPYFTGSGTAAVADFTSYGRGLVAVASEAAFKTLVNLEIGTDVQEYDADLTAIAALAKTDGNIIVGDGSTWVAESGATARTSLGLGTGDTPQFTGLDLGGTDATLTRDGAGDLAIEGNVVYRAGGTDIPLSDGGTGSSLSDPGADRILFWDESSDAVTWLTAGSGLTISGTTISVDAADVGYTPGGTDVALADGGTGSSLSDPGADRILFWDDSSGTVTWLTAGTGLTISTTTISVNTSSENAAGIVELATDAEAQAGTDTARAITPANLQAVTATEIRKGVVELATTAEVTTGTDTERAVTPAGVKAAIDAISLAALVPVGVVVPYAGATAPTGWLLCFGQEISRTTYSDLFTAISTTYGVGDGSTTFALPDLRGRVVAGQDDMGGTSANRLTNQTGGLNGDTLGATGGAETHALTASQIPDNQLGSVREGGDAPQSIGGDNDHTGTGAAHNNVQPTIILNYIIYTGVTS